VRAALLREIQDCADCCVVSDGAQLPEGVEYWTLLSGVTMNFPGGLSLPLSSDFILCPPHSQRANAEYEEEVKTDAGKDG
jgi:hypothetical protein